MLKRYFFLLLISIQLMLTTTIYAAEKGLLWRAEALSGRVSYVFGTMHDDDPRINDFSPTLIKALTESEVFMMEVTPNGNPAVYRMKDQSLKNLMTEAELEKIRALADIHSIIDSNAYRMKPWLLAIMLDLPKPESPFTQDIELHEKAQQLRKEIDGVEDEQAHFSVMDDLPMEEQLTILRTVINRSQKDRVKDYDKLLEAYLSGDLDKIQRVDSEATAKSFSKPLWDKVRLKLLDERNAKMVAVIAEKGEKQSLFVAVGASHLGGDKGLLHGLRAAGFKVSVVKQ